MKTFTYFYEVGSLQKFNQNTPGFYESNYADSIVHLALLSIEEENIDGKSMFYVDKPKQTGIAGEEDSELSKKISNKIQSLLGTKEALQGYQDYMNEFAGESY